MKAFKKMCKDLKINDTTDQILKKCSKVAIRDPYLKNIRKSKEWPSPKLLEFVQANLMFLFLYDLAKYLYLEINAVFLMVDFTCNYCTILL